jgi:hypothetical protein
MEVSKAQNDSRTAKDGDTVLAYREKGNPLAID